MFSGASNFVEGVDLAFAVIIGISLFFLIGITLVMIYFLIKYSKKKNPEPGVVKDSTGLEITWTVIPTILVLIMFYYGWAGYAPMRDFPEEGIHIKVHGYTWQWRFYYDEEESISSDTNLVVPVNTPIILDLYSSDVLHSFYVPAFRIKEDVVPGVDNKMWFEAKQEGEFTIFCTEYCGQNHSTMVGNVIVKSKEDYEKWLAEKQAPSNSSTTDNTPDDQKEVTGRELVQQHICLSCHSLDGSRLVGPSFKGLYGTTRTVVDADGKTIEIEADEAYIKKSIYEPDAHVVESFPKGTMTPQNYKDKISEEEVTKIINYIKSLDE